MKRILGKNFRSVTSVILSAALLLTSLGVSMLFGSAITVDTGAQTALTEFSEDFEGGITGWTKTSLNYGINASSGDVTGFRSSGGTYNDEFPNAYTMAEATESGNKVLSLTKTGAGYTAATSAAIPVTPDTTYTVSALFKEFADNTSYPNPITNGYYDANTALVIKEFATSDTALTNNLAYIKLDSEKNSSDWSRLAGYFTTADTTNYIVVYLCVGSQWNVRNVVYFDDVTLTKAGFNGDFEAGAANWKLTSMNYDYAGSYTIDSAGTYIPYFSLAGAVDDAKGNVLAVSKNGSGYAAATSGNYSVNALTDYAVSVDLRRYSYSEVGTNGITDFNTALCVAEYDNAGALIAYHKLASAVDSDSWGKLKGVITTTANTGYIVIFLTVGAQWNIRETVYFDNVKINEVGHNFDFEAGAVGEDVINWTETSMENNTNTKSTTDYTGSFTLKNADDNGNQVLAINKTGSGYIAATSLPYKVIGGAEYKISFDYMLKSYEAKPNSTNGLNYLGTRLLYEELDADKNVIKALGNSTVLFATHVNVVTADDGWSHVDVDLTVSPEAKYVVFYFYAGGQWNIYTTTYFDDLEVKLSSSEIFESPLYNKTAVFAGDAIGSGLAAEAESYSRMQVTDVCGSTPLKEQLETLSGRVFDYLFISIGDAEIKAGIPAGSVASGECMRAEGYGTATFAGLIEQALAYVTEYTEPAHAVYLLPTADAGYKAVADAACTKWGVTLAVISDTANAEVGWSDTVAPAEGAPVFDSFAVSGFADYLVDKALEISNAGLSFESRETLDKIISTAERCPATHANYSDFAGAADSARVVIAQYDSYAPLMLGATIASNDPNQLQFIAAAPSKALSNGITVVKMGVLVMKAEDMSKAGAAFEVGNSFVKELNADYANPLEAYYPVISNEDADAFTEYAAVAYIIYNENGKEYTFYSKNDYDFGFGYDTAEGGMAVKSIVGIAKKIAAALVAELEAEMDFTAIGGAENKDIISTATEREDLKKIYRLVCDNAELVSKLFD